MQPWWRETSFKNIKKYYRPQIFERYICKMLHDSVGCYYLRILQAYKSPFQNSVIFASSPWMCFWKQLLFYMISTSADSQPTKLRGLLFFLLLFFLLGRGDGSLSLEGGKSSSWCLIITVITFCIMGVPVCMRWEQSSSLQGVNQTPYLKSHSYSLQFRLKVP